MESAEREVFSAGCSAHVEPVLLGKIMPDSGARAVKMRRHARPETRAVVVWIFLARRL
jgi:hypothetical protein